MIRPKSGELWELNDGRLVRILTKTSWGCIGVVSNHFAGNEECFDHEGSAGFGSGVLVRKLEDAEHATAGTNETTSRGLRRLRIV